MVPGDVVFAVGDLEHLRKERFAVVLRKHPQFSDPVDRTEIHEHVLFLAFAAQRGGPAVLGPFVDQVLFDPEPVQFARYIQIDQAGDHDLEFTEGRKVPAG